MLAAIFERTILGIGEPIFGDKRRKVAEQIMLLQIMGKSQRERETRVTKDFHVVPIAVRVCLRCVKSANRSKKHKNSPELRGAHKCYGRIAESTKQQAQTEGPTAALRTL